MKFSENWLRKMCDPEMDSEELAHALTMAGLEVEEVIPVSQFFSGVLIGEVKAVQSHAKADRLKICEVDTGNNEILSIVCGAPNVVKGIKVACAIVGSKLGQGQIKKTTIRGAESEGMLCSEQELGVSDNNDGIWVLPQDAPLGEDIRSYCDLDDKIFSLKLTPNRGDCLSILGIAREVSAVSRTPLNFEYEPKVEHTISDTLTVNLIDTAACPKYSGRIIQGVNVKTQTPSHIIRRLARSGIRSINAVVDLTNYVMLEIGQPMHAFDQDKLKGEVSIRFAREGESLKLLNGEDISLTNDMLTINDSGGPIALAGIMGGLETSVDRETTNLFLESAFFSSFVVSGKWRELGFSTDALYRYERGVDFDLSEVALDRLSALIVEVCGGAIGPVTVSEGILPKRESVKLRVHKCEKILGFPIGSDRIKDCFKRLKLPFSQDSNSFCVTPPSYRFDIEIEEDLIEEVARVDGYDKLPSVSPRDSLGFVPINQRLVSFQKVKEHFISRQYNEVITYGFVEEKWEKDFGTNGKKLIFLKNPIANHLDVMRSTLTGSLVSVLRFNQNRYQERVRVFEVSRVFKDSSGQIHQPYVCSGIACGAVFEQQWGHKDRSIDFFDLKGDLQPLFSKEEVFYEKSSHDWLHPGRSASIRVNETIIGWLGELHPRILRKYELQGPVVAFEFTLDDVMDNDIPVFREVSKFPPVVRDISILVESNKSAGEILNYLNKLGLSYVERIDLFDVYLGKGIEKGQKGLAFRLLLQDTGKTLTDSDTEMVIGEALEGLKKTFQAKPRR